LRQALLHPESGGGGGGPPLEGCNKACRNCRRFVNAQAARVARIANDNSAKTKTMFNARKIKPHHIGNFIGGSIITNLFYWWPYNYKHTHAKLLLPPTFLVQNFKLYLHA